MTCVFPSLQGHSYGAQNQNDIKTIAMSTPFKRGSLHRRSSYAFSHKEGYADLITKGTSLRKRHNSGQQTPEAAIPQE